MPASLPPRFDPDHYRAANPDLALAGEEAAAHYERIGRAEGRVASPLALRENLVALIDDGRSVLEIGPFCDPLLRGPDIAYLDILDADQLRARAIEIGRDPDGCPASIDYVGGLEQVQRRFDAIISCHAIEHQPDLVQHLEQIERILEPDGLFCLVIPDKRYCFDHFIAESTIGDVLQAHREQRRTHSLSSVIAHIALSTHNDPHHHWQGDHGPAVPPDRAARLRKAMADYEAGEGGYIDVHAWFFTPDSFAAIIESLGELGLTGLELAGVYDSAHGRNEFCAVLRLREAARAHARRLADAGEVLATAPMPMIGTARKPVRDDRWTARLAHRGLRQEPLLEAPAGVRRLDLLPAIRSAWSLDPAATAIDPAWRGLTDAFDRGEDDAAAAELAALGRSPIAAGYLGGARQHERARDRGFADRLALWTYDKLLSLAEAVGAVPLENPENGPWGESPQSDPAALFRAIEAALGADLSPPPAIGSYLGIAVRDGLILHMRMIDSIYAAWRLRQRADELGLGAGARIAELGGGAALTAYYALRLGLRHYRLFDLPTMNLVQAYVLAGAGHDVSLHGEAGPVAILRTDAFGAQPPGSIDILFNEDGLPLIGRDAAGILADARHLGVPHLLSINQEAEVPGGIAAARLAREGGYRLVSRHRHWLRAGYVEESYSLAQPHSGPA